MGQATEGALLVAGIKVCGKSHFPFWILFVCWRQKYFPSCLL
jgi:hypothetical protein